MGSIVNELASISDSVHELLCTAEYCVDNHDERFGPLEAQFRAVLQRLDQVTRQAASRRGGIRMSRRKNPRPSGPLPCDPYDKRQIGLFDGPGSPVRLPPRARVLGSVKRRTLSVKNRDTTARRQMEMARWPCDRGIQAGSARHATWFLPGEVRQRIDIG